MDGPNVNGNVLSLHSSYREKNQFSRLINIGSCGHHVLRSALQTGNRLGSQQSFTCDVENFLMNHPQGEIFISGKLVVIFFLCIFARPGGLRMNTLLHVVFRYGKISCELLAFMTKK